MCTFLSLVIELAVSIEEFLLRDINNGNLSNLSGFLAFRLVAFGGHWIQVVATIFIIIVLKSVVIGLMFGGMVGEAPRGWLDLDDFFVIIVIVIIQVHIIIHYNVIFF